MAESVDLQSLLASLAHAAPPPFTNPALLGIWHALRGEWERAHDAVQPDTTDCAWVHAVLHREEEDLPNASYWYQQAHRPVIAGPVREEYLAIARELLKAPR